MTWILTNSGKQFHFDKFNPDDVCLQDIAHALSYQCRYNGHGHAFYSIAEHSMNIASYIMEEAIRLGKDEQGKKLVKQALLHDAAEAYCGDMVHPLKMLMPAFKQYEEELMGNILAKYGCSRKLAKKVKELDTRIMLNEKRVLFPANTPRWELEDQWEPLPGVVIHCFTPDVIYPVYLSTLKGVFDGYE